MNVELELSLQLPDAAFIQPLLDEFETRHHIHVKPRLLNWDTAWGELVKMALYNDGPDVSEVGSTWLGDLVAMSGLHALRADEINAVGKASAFLPAAYQGCHLAGETEVWAVPWLVGARLIVYRRALLQRAGVAEEAAFSTAEHCEQTLRQLQARSAAAPWIVPVSRTHTTLLNLASWVWAAGGDFVTPDGKRALIAQHQTITGLRNYFALGRFITAEARRQEATRTEHWFLQQATAAATISGPWLFQFISSTQRDEFGLALPLGTPLLGGSHLVMWKHSRKQEAVLKLIAFLTQPDIQVRYAQRVGLLPAVVEALNDNLYKTDRLWRTAAQAVQASRAVPTVRSWGLMEDRLAVEFANVWTEFLADPTQDLVTLLTQHLGSLAHRLDQVLA